MRAFLMGSSTGSQAKHNPQNPLVRLRFQSETRELLANQRTTTG